MKARFKRQILGFLSGGILGVCVDAICYRIFMEFIPPAIAKGFSFVAGSMFSYSVNHKYSFQGDSHRRQLPRFALLYFSSLMANTLINALCLHLGFLKTIGFLAATATSTILNFLGLKFFVFEKDRPCQKP